MSALCPVHADPVFDHKGPDFEATMYGIYRSMFGVKPEDVVSDPPPRALAAT